MPLSTFIQLLAACIGVIGSLFFAIGVMRQSIEAMGLLSGTYWDSNPYIPPMLAAQKADYLFGGGLIVIAFSMQLTSFLVPSEAIVFSATQAPYIAWLMVLTTFCMFFVLRFLARRLAMHYEGKINKWLKDQD